MTTFHVSDVKLATKALPGIDVAESIQSMVSTPVEACGSNATGTLVKVTKPMNSFLQSMHLAFNHHYPLALSPDDVWVCIAQGLALHINANEEELKKQFVKHEGKLVLEHENIYTKGSPNNDWQSSFKWFSKEIKKLIGKKHALIVSDFSTTGPVEKAASEIVLMDAMQNYFSYQEMTLCGIPEITLLGTLEDWESIRARAEALSEFGLSWWTDHLLPVLDQFVAAKNYNPNPAFWQSFYHWNSGSGGPQISGHVINLFPYIKGDCSFDLKNTELGNTKHRWGTSPGEFPIGLSKAPFIWKYLGTEYNMDFLGGFVGSSQDPESLVVRPALGWAVRDSAEK